MVSKRRLRFPRIKRRLLRILLILAGVWLIFCVVIAGVVYVYGLTDRAQAADVIIVLGSGLNRNLTPGPSLTHRSERAAELWHEGYAPMILCAGGVARWATRSEADGCAEVLRNNGVPAEAMVLEERSRSTEENAAYSHEIMQARGWNRALVVSDGYHLLRASWIFSAEGIDFTTSPTSTPPLFSNLVVALGREVVALHWQVVKTVLGLPYTYVPWV
ncbi:MAG: YdcF family protein [Chloroflexota bacterium]